jgi:hypothetical protein
VDRLDELVGYHDLRFSDGTHLYDEVRALAEEVHRELTPYYVRPVDRLGDEEGYTVFCIQPFLTSDGARQNAEDWLSANRRAVASLLTEESDYGRVSADEAEESTSKSYSYCTEDLAVID